jgi:transposase-like protein
MESHEAKLKQQKFVELLGKGQTAKEISKQIGVSEKTLSQWKRNLPQWDYIKLTKAVKIRLEKAISTHETTHTDIYNLTNSLAKLERLARFE